MSEPAQKKCEPCEGKTDPLNRETASQYLAEVPKWNLSENAKAISRQYKMKNFTAAVELITKIKDVAESENHHPDIHLTGYRNLAVELSTHSIGGLSENDFIVAAKINELPAELKS